MLKNVYSIFNAFCLRSIIDRYMGIEELYVGEGGKIYCIAYKVLLPAQFI